MTPTSSEIYIETLEKTNQQLSLWYNPYGVMVGVLTLLVAILAIYFAYILWRQGRDYRDFLDEQKRFAAEQTEAYLKSFLDERAAELNTQMETLAGDARASIEREIQALQEVSKSFNTYGVYGSLRAARNYRNTQAHDPLGIASRKKINTNELSESQILAIISLLQSFGADSGTIVDVEKSLRGRQ